ncbi:hypothetical protein CsSME_00047183 [Camellia sinensis var. sinensis]|uniref:Tetrapyrrole biosynthesis glutamyl-tRNA reductase dimerisation domain-containing protein n=2 Tax=Camellia sinensis TaxID=4442 RepID=A0A4S4DN87_CAMSN|nr:hypothetical protein TEA_022650 [Camellia sinensis var. sinensis]THG18994.1 hypothetical protein TEA_021542 [Camellia sinensis var. sinensis]
MAVSPFPSLIKSHSHVPILHHRFAVVERKQSHVISATATTIAVKPSTTQRPNQLLQLINPIVTKNQVLFKDQHTKEMNYECEGLGNKEVRMVMERLERVAERMREIELEKMKGRLRGNMSCEDGMVMEMMSREIVSSFLEKPIQYLKSCDGKLDDRLKDFKFFVGILEQSCFTNEKINTHV